MKRVWLCALALLLMVAAGCARKTGETGPQSSVDIYVTNNLIPPGTVEIFLVPRSGIERSLGNLSSGTVRFQHRGLPLTGEYQLIARKPSGATLPSPIVTLDNVRAIRWDMLRNFLDLQTGE